MTAQLPQWPSGVSRLVVRISLERIFEEPADLGVDVLAGEPITSGSGRIRHCREVIDRRGAAGVLD
jgi:hypothetical protein